MKILFVFGTRPEAIKMAPLIIECLHYPDEFEVEVCLTGQHREMLDQVVEFFDLPVQYDLKLMKPNQTLSGLTADAVKLLEPVLAESKPNLVVVQGDTTTAFAGALAAFYAKTKIAHLEAGLRSGSKYSPFPEEINRMLVGRMADFHFCPTSKAQENLAKEGIAQNAWVVGNTVIDALLLGLEIIKEDGLDFSAEKEFSKVDFAKHRVILVTGHRRESFGEPFEHICRALLTIVEKFPDTEIIYPVHLNPNVQKPVNEILHNHPRVHLIKPLDYPRLIWLMHRSHLVLTDSGGIQEEAPSLGKPVLVMREVTERTEGIDAGTARLVGTNQERIVEEASLLLSNKQAYQKMARAVNPYGDGTTSQQIVDIIHKMAHSNGAFSHH